MPARIEVGELVDAIKYIGDEFLEKQPRRHSHFASKIASDGASQNADIFIVNRSPDPLR
jgi:hypothetical protein